MPFQATFFIFCPKIDEYLNGYVAAKKSSSKFMHQGSVQVHVTSLSYRNGRPHMFESIEKVDLFIFFCH